MLILLSILIFVFIFYKILRPKKGVRKMTAFDAYLIDQHKKSENLAKLIPDIDDPHYNAKMKAYEVIKYGKALPSVLDTETDKRTIVVNEDISWTERAYLDMLLYNNDPELRQEAMSILNITEQELNKKLGK